MDNPNTTLDVKEVAEHLWDKYTLNNRYERNGEEWHEREMTKELFEQAITEATEGLRKENERLDDEVEKFRHKYFELQDEVVPRLTAENEQLKDRLNKMVGELDEVVRYYTGVYFGGNIRLIEAERIESIIEKYK